MRNNIVNPLTFSLFVFVLVSLYTSADVPKPRIIPYPTIEDSNTIEMGTLIQSEEGCINATDNSEDYWCYSVNPAHTGSLPSHNGQESLDGRLLLQNITTSKSDPNPSEVRTAGFAFKLLMPEIIYDSGATLQERSTEDMKSAYRYMEEGAFSESIILPDTSPSAAIIPYNYFNIPLNNRADLQSAFTGLTGQNLVTQKAHICMTEDEPVTRLSSYTGSDGEDYAHVDRYKVQLILFYTNSEQFRLGKTSADVYVENAKGTNASIVDIVIPFDSSDIDTFDLSDNLFPFRSMPELNFTRDGRLMVGRPSYFPQQGTGFFFNKSSDIIDRSSNVTQGSDQWTTARNFYAYSESACDVATWGKTISNTPASPSGHTREVFFANLKPLTAANEYLKVTKENSSERRYGFSHYPMRDSEGTTFSAGAPLNGTYPWVDARGDNILFLKDTINFIDSEGKPRYETEGTIPSRTGEDAVLDNGVGNGIAAVGLWTHGKVVYEDSMLSESEIRLNEDGLLILKDFYTVEDDESVDIAIRGTSGGTDDYRTRDPDLRSYVKSNGRISSIQNMLNYYDAMRPTVPRDVVWYVSRGFATDQMVFDTWIDPNVIIFAPMNASVTSGPELQSVTNDGFGSNSQYNVAEARIQNAATSLAYNTPKFGQLIGDVRIEPVALGGIKGKGLYLSNNGRVVFKEENKLAGSVNERLSDQGYVGMFFDPRGISETNNVHSVLMTLPKAGGGQAFVTYNPHKKRIGLIDKNDNTPQWWRPGEHDIDNSSVTIPEPIDASLKTIETWHHIGLFLTSNENNQTAMVYYNGNHIGNIELGEEKRLSLFEGDVYIGRDGTNSVISDFAGTAAPLRPFTGWVDDFVLVANTGQFGNGRANNRPELLCNHARGTMALIQPGSSYYMEAGNYDNDLARAAIERQVPDFVLNENDRFMCMTDYSDHRGVNPQNFEDTEISLRNYFLLFERPSVNNPIDELQAEFGVKTPFNAYENKPRFDRNAFCLSCHVRDDVEPDRRSTLSLEALQAGSQIFMHDMRRMPMNTPVFQDPSGIASCLHGQTPMSVDNANGQSALGLTSQDHFEADCYPVDINHWAR